MSARQSLLLLPALIVPCCVPSQNEPFQLVKMSAYLYARLHISHGSFLKAKAGLAFLLLLGEHILSTIFQVLSMSPEYHINWKHWYVRSSHLRSLEIVGSWQPPVPPAPRRIWHLLAFVGAVLMSTYLYTDARIHINTDTNKSSF